MLPVDIGTVCNYCKNFAIYSLGKDKIPLCMNHLIIFLKGIERVNEYLNKALLI